MSKLSRNTERAISLITIDQGNPYLYWPSYLRSGKRVRPDGVVTTNPPTEKEQLERIVEADPLGWLIAGAHGLPLPTLHKNDAFDSSIPEDPITNPRYRVQDEFMNMSMRRDVMQHLLTKLIGANKRARAKPTNPKTASIFDAVEERATAEQDESD